jgi:hypothetical protein
VKDKKRRGGQNVKRHILKKAQYQFVKNLFLMTYGGSLIEKYLKIYLT